jgi:hypothetical protein
MTNWDDSELRSDSKVSLERLKDLDISSDWDKSFGVRDETLEGYAVAIPLDNYVLWSASGSLFSSKYFAAVDLLSQSENVPISAAYEVVGRALVARLESIRPTCRWG